MSEFAERPEREKLEMDTPKTVVAAAAASLLILVVFCVGRWTAPRSDGPTVHEGEAYRPLPGHTAASRSAPGETVAAPGSLNTPHRTHSETVGSAADEAVHSEPGLPEAHLEEFFQAARAVGEQPSDHHVQEAAQAASSDLAGRLMENPGALDEALRAFRARTDRAELELLAVTLARVRDPRVEEVALDLARSDSHTDRRAGALDILDALNTPDALDVALEILKVETDVDLRRAALRAIPEPNGSSRRAAGPVVKQLQRLLKQDPDVELRRRSAVLLGSWHRSLDEFLPVLRALSSDESATVRAGCAFACEVAMRREGDVLTVLTQVVSDRSEAFLVRENAYRALRILGPLPDTAHRAFTSFQLELEREQEAVR